jgi:hypothetical protein
LRIEQQEIVSDHMARRNLDFRCNLRRALVELFTKAFHGLEYVLVALQNNSGFVRQRRASTKDPIVKMIPITVQMAKEF